MPPDELFSPNGPILEMKGAPSAVIVKLTRHTKTRGSTPINKHNTATTKTARVKESFTLKNATIFGGANIGIPGKVIFRLSDKDDPCIIPREVYPEQQPAVRPRLPGVGADNFARRHEHRLCQVFRHARSDRKEGHQPFTGLWVQLFVNLRARLRLTRQSPVLPYHPVSITKTSIPIRWATSISALMRSRFMDSRYGRPSKYFRRSW